MLSNFGTGTGRGTEVFQNRGAGTDSVPVPAFRNMVDTTVPLTTANGSVLTTFATR